MNKKNTLYFLLLLLIPKTFLFSAIGSVAKANLVIYALEQRDFKTANFLFKESPELLTTPNEKDISPMAFAVKQDDAFLLKYLINIGAPIESSYYKEPLLFLAMYMNAKKSLITLLELGANPKVTSRSLNPLHIAVILDKMDLFNILIQYGADPNKVDRFGLSPFHMAALKKNWAFVKVLAPMTQNLNTLDNKKQTPLIYYMQQSSSDLKNFLGVMQEYLPNMLSFQTNKTPPPLFWCITLKDSSCLEILLSKGANLNTKDIIMGDTPLIFAVKKGDEEMVKTLLKWGPNLNIKNRKKKTALSLAQNNEPILDLITQKIKEEHPAE